MVDLTDSKVDIETSSVRFAHSHPIMLAMNNLRFSLEPLCLVAYILHGSMLVYLEDTISVTYAS